MAAGSAPDLRKGPAPLCFAADDSATLRGLGLGGRRRRCGRCQHVVPYTVAARELGNMLRSSDFSLRRSGSEARPRVGEGRPPSAGLGIEAATSPDGVQELGPGAGLRRRYPVDRCRSL